MAVTFSGVVSAQASAGEEVIVVVTKPNGGTDTWTTLTTATGAYSITEQYAVAGNYSYTASIAADSAYKAVSTQGVFTIS